MSFLPAGATDWVEAMVNRPLWTGDRLWTGAGARAELQTSNAALRIAPDTSLSVVAFDDRTAQYEVNQGTLRLRVRSLDRDEAIEVDTPNLAFSIRSAGDYRIDVDSDATTVAVYRGSGEAYGAQTAYVIGAGKRIRFGGTNLNDYEPVALARADAFDAWVLERARLDQRSISARYVAPDVIGYEDLDTYGTWRVVPDYGNVWIPTRVAADWAPYRYGRWAWVDPWGWTWIDDAPWGFAPSHYGRWAFVESRWCWVPGPRTARAVYAPALVAFVGTTDVGVSLAVGGGAVAWFPLGPGEVYRPAYRASRDYFTRVNVTNTTINVTQVTNIYDNPRTEIRHVNVERPNAVTAVPAQAFVEARPVQRAAVKVDPRALQSAPVVAAPTHLAPQRASIVGTTTAAQTRPNPAVTERPVIAKRQPPPPPPPIEQREQALKREPGKPLDQAALQKLAPPANATRANVHVAQPTTPPKPLPVAASRAAEKERPAQNARAQETPAPAGTPARREAAPVAGNGKVPVNARPQGQEGVARTPPPPSSAPPVASDTSRRPPGEERAKPATRPNGAEAKASEPPQRSAAPRASEPPQRSTASNQRAPQPAPRPEVAKAPEREPPRGPPARARQPENASAPPAGPEPPRRQATAPPASTVPGPNPQPHAAQRAPEAREQPPVPAARQAPPRPEAASRGAPPEPPRQQAAAQPPRAAEARPQPSPSPRAAEPPQRNAPGKGKGNETDKQKDKEDGRGEGK